MVAPAQLSMLGGGFALGLFVGFLMTYMYMKFSRMRIERLYESIMRARVIGLIIDVSENRTEIVPLVPIKKGLYFSAHPEYPMIVIVPPEVQPSWSFLFNRPILYVISFKIYGFAMNPDLLTTFGIAKLGLKIGAWECRDLAPNCVEELAKELYRNVGKEETVEIPITPDIRLAIAVNVPKVIEKLQEYQMSYASAVMTGLQEVVMGVDEFVKYQQRKLATALAGRQMLLKFIIILLLVGLIGGAIFIFLTSHGAVPPVIRPH